MKLSEFVKKYRQENDVSQREFAKRAHVTNGYVWMIENETNPKTGKPIIPSLGALIGIASAMGMTVDDLLEAVEDLPVTLKTPRHVEKLTEEEAALLEAFREASPEMRDAFFKLITRI